MNPQLQSRTFALGRILITASVENIIERAEIDAALGRHARGDWGDVRPEDWRANQIALREGERVFSTYTDRRQTRFYIITEADRSATTVLLPGDY
jgi:hypothetical protein